METLLTPTESLAFQSFLAAVDTSHPPSDWATYASQFDPSSANRDDDDIILNSLAPPPENESLAKATKDLMSLDAVGWSDTSMMPPNQHQHQQQPLMYDHQIQHHQQTQPLLTQPLHRQHSYSSVHEPFPFLNPKGSNVPFQQQQQYPHPHPLQQPSLNLNHMNSPTTPTDMFSFPQQHQQQQQQPHPSTHQPSIPSTAPAAKRAIRSNSVRIPPSANPPVRQRRSSQSPRPSQGTAKPALLSPSQKKANHIQSEQKRRANIRRGYEALCETVPALREAIREEEEEIQRAAALAAAGLANGGPKGKASGKKRAAKKKEVEEGGSGSGAKDKIDGRAGPRSENVVLSKTIDYVNELLSERANLLARLQKARSALPPGHPSLTPLSPEPAWEREWKGGEGKFGGEDEEEGEESEGEGEGEDDRDSPQVNGTKGKQRTSRTG
ncbi:hypothetical protein H1R20_g8726, partial [Candolleomyces eurysporus]